MQVSVRRMHAHNVHFDQFVLLYACSSILLLAVACCGAFIRHTGLSRLDAFDRRWTYAAIDKIFERLHTSTGSNLAAINVVNCVEQFNLRMARGKCSVMQPDTAA